MPGDLHVLFRYLGDSSDPRKYAVLLHEQHRGRGYAELMAVRTGYVSVRTGHCGGDEYRVGHMLFHEKSSRIKSSVKRDASPHYLFPITGRGFMAESINGAVDHF